MEEIVKVQGLVKNYHRTTALDNVSFNIEKGKITGLLGPNGSGKTTIIKVLTGLLKQYDGEVLINGKKPGVESKDITSYLPDVEFINSNWTGEEAISVYKHFYQDFREDRAYGMANKVRLDLKKRFSQLSKGNKEKLQLILILARNAKLYIFDEPIAAVDPATREVIFDLILNNYNRDGAIIICTHLILDVERILDKVIFLQEGKVIFDGNVSDVKESGKSLDEKFREVFRCY